MNVSIADWYVRDFDADHNLFNGRDVLETRYHVYARTRRAAICRGVDINPG